MGTTVMPHASGAHLPHRHQKQTARCALLHTGPSHLSVAYGSGFGFVPAARAALTSARDAALRSACASDFDWLGSELGAELADALELDEVLAVARDGVSPERLVDPPGLLPYPPGEPDGVKRPVP